MTPIVCRCFHIFASDRTGAKWERFSIPVKSSTRSQDRRKQVVEPSVVSKRGATFMCFEARLSSPCEGVAFDRCPKTKIPSCARRSTLHATVAAAHPACLCAPSTPTTSPGRTDGEDRREQTEKRHTKAQARRPSATHRARHRRRRTPSMSVRPQATTNSTWHGSGEDSENQTVSSGPASAPSTQAVPSSATHRKHRPRRHPSTTPAHPQTPERFDTRIGRPPAPKQQVMSPPVTLRLPPERAAHRTYLVSGTTGKHHAPHRDARARRATERAARRIPWPE